jgi:hypothetical protein
LIIQKADPPKSNPSLAVREPHPEKQGWTAFSGHPCTKTVDKSGFMRPDIIGTNKGEGWFLPHPYSIEFIE